MREESQDNNTPAGTPESASSCCSSEAESVANSLSPESRRQDVETFTVILLMHCPVNAQHGPMRIMQVCLLSGNHQPRCGEGVRLGQGANLVFTSPAHGHGDA